MKKLILTVAIVLLASCVLEAQHGSAPNDYYPPGYSGDTWTGVVTSVDDHSREITLTYTKGDKTETFTGILKQGYKVKSKDGSEVELKPSEIPTGVRLTVFYSTQTKKVDGNKVKVYEIFRLKQLPEEKKR
jgi:hypothetical protein